MPIQHPFVSSVTDIGGPTYVQPTHWNAPHQTMPFLAFSYSPASQKGQVMGQGTPMPSAYVEWAGNHHGWYDFTNVSQVRLTMRMTSGNIAAPSAQMHVQFSADGGSNWMPLATGAGTGPFVGIGTGGQLPLTTKVGSWFAINPSAVAAGSQGVILRFVSFMGDGVITPVVTSADIFVL